MIGLQYRSEQRIFVDDCVHDRRTFLRKRARALCGRQASRKKIIVLSDVNGMINSYGSRLINNEFRQILDPSSNHCKWHD